MRLTPSTVLGGVARPVLSSDWADGALEHKQFNLGQDPWRNRRFKDMFAELFDALKRLNLLVVQEAQYA